MHISSWNIVGVALRGHPFWIGEEGVATEGHPYNDFSFLAADDGMWFQD